MNLIALQYDIAWEDKRANHEKVRAMLHDSAILPGDLVVLPEMFATGFSMNVPAVEEGPDHPSESFLAQLARELQVCIVGGVVNRATQQRGSMSRGESGSPRVADPRSDQPDASASGENQAVAYGPQGLLARYTKIHPYTFGNEGQHYTAGARVVTFEWNGAVVAPFVCYDLRFAEVFRLAARRGAQIMAVIANWPARRSGHWTTLLHARAIENQAYVVGVNRIGSDPNASYIGDSRIIDPMGVALAAAGDRQSVVRAAADLGFVRQWREQFPALRDMRREFLGE